jgi:hypothetical protein
MQIDTDLLSQRDPFGTDGHPIPSPSASYGAGRSQIEFRNLKACEIKTPSPKAKNFVVPASLLTG